MGFKGRGEWDVGNYYQAKYENSQYIIRIEILSMLRL